MPGKTHPPALALTAVLLLLAAAAGCAAPTISPTPGITATTSATLPQAVSSSPTAYQAVTPAPSATFDPAQPWLPYPTPRHTPITPIPPPLSGLVVDGEVRSLLLVGTDRNAPFIGRTDAVLLLLYHPRLSRASVISLPPDMLVYLPGYAMQRLEVAYALGGARMLAQTIQYNFGIRPDHTALVHLDAFKRFIDESLDGLDVNVLQAYPDPKYCGGIPTGVFHMTGEQVLCYIRFRVGADEADRNRRQQEVFRTILLRLLQSGNLARLPEIYAAFRNSVESDLSLAQLLEYIPLALRLGDANRINFYHLNTEDLPTWEMPNETGRRVFLAERSLLLPMLQQAAYFVLTPAPLSEIVRTLEFQLTFVPTATATRTITPTPLPTATRTITPTPTITLTPTVTPTGPTLTPTLTPTGPTPTSATAYP